MAELNDVRGDINTMKSDIAEVKAECVKAKSDIAVVKAAQTKSDAKVNKLKTTDGHIQSSAETMQLDIDQLNDDFQSKLDLIADLDVDLDRLERESRKSTMRIFGLSEESGERKEDAKRIVAEKVLKVACEKENWSLDDLLRAYRVGEANENQPRIMIVSFRYSDDK